MGLLKKNVRTKMEKGRELVSEVVGQFKTWRDAVSEGIENLASHKTDNEKTIAMLNLENQELTSEIVAAQNFKKKIEQLMGDAGIPNTEGEEKV